ncbi:MAG: hypothetical protein L6416_12430 [Candidatus Omnitrophica bacterium]|nr:hypothetical protein [Candidatus Omnitrophota bacterium]
MNKKHNHKYRGKNSLIKQPVAQLNICKRETGKRCFLLFIIKIKSICDEAGIFFALFFRAGILSLLNMPVKAPIRTNYFNPGIAGFVGQSKTR